MARSKDVPASAVLLGGLLFLSYYGNSMLHGLQGQLSDFLRLRPPQDITTSYVYTLAFDAIVRITLLIGPMMLVICFVGSLRAMCSRAA